MDRIESECPTQSKVEQLFHFDHLVPLQQHAQHVPPSTTAAGGKGKGGAMRLEGMPLPRGGLSNAHIAGISAAMAPPAPVKLSVKRK